MQDKHLPVERFDTRLALELEERTEFVEWTLAASNTTSSTGTNSTTVSASGKMGNWP